MARKSQTTVGLNSKLTAVNLMAIPFDGADTFLEGAPVIINSTTGNADVPDAYSPAIAATYQTVFINFVDSSRSDIEFLQGDAFDATAPTVSIAGGGLTGIVGNGLDIGLPASCWNHSGSLPTIGYKVSVSNGASAKGTLWQGYSPAVKGKFHGVVYRHYNSRAYFLFSSIPTVYTTNSPAVIGF